ncbi:MAG: carbohydrate ABC transporter permease [Christensenellales bacterium]|jgi:putative aldouronate transport system permease protein
MQEIQDNAIKKNIIRNSRSDLVFYFFNYIFLFLCFMVVFYPIWNVIVSSVSSPQEVIAGRVTLWPRKFNTNAYQQVFANKMLMGGYKNSITYTFAGTLVNIVMTIALAYPLSRKDFVGRGAITAIFVFTMIFSAPLIPSYLNIRRLGLIDTFWVMVLPTAISTYNMIIARTFFQSSIADEMLEAAELDGASDMRILINLVLPLSKAIIAVLVLYYAVSHWNTYFNALIYLNTETKFPLQLVLRTILTNAQQLQEMAENISDADSAKLALVEVMKYAIIVFGSLPVLMLYPFVQKYFVKGVMIGSLKG